MFYCHDLLLGKSVLKGGYTRGIFLPEQAPGERSGSKAPPCMCTNDFMGILHPREQSFNFAKCFRICNRLNIWEQTPGAN